LEVLFLAEYETRMPSIKAILEAIPICRARITALMFEALTLSETEKRVDRILLDFLAIRVTKMVRGPKGEFIEA
jgi:hypothetical protein